MNCPVGEPAVGELGVGELGVGELAVGEQTRTRDSRPKCRFKWIFWALMRYKGDVWTLRVT